MPIALSFVISTLIGCNLYLLVRALDPLVALLLYPDQYSQFFVYAGSTFDAIKIAVGCFIIPVFEEYVFRKKLVEILAFRTGHKFACVISIIVFTAAHIQYYNTPYIINMLLLAIICQRIINRTGKLSQAVACHSIFNLAILLPKVSLTTIFLFVNMANSGSQNLVLALLVILSGITILVLLSRMPRPNADRSGS